MVASESLSSSSSSSSSAVSEEHLDLESVATDLHNYQIQAVNNELEEDALELVSLNKSVSKELSKIATLPPLADDDPYYDKFTELEKNLFVFIIGFTNFLSPLSNLAFTPAIPEIASDLNTTSQMINITNAIFNVFMAISPMMLTPLGPIYGKKIVLFSSTLGFVICTILTAVSVNLPMFFIFRALSAFSGTACFSVGGNIVGDIKRPKERGRALGWILIGTQLGPCFGPVMGGIIVTYTSWRVIFWVITGLAAFDCGLILICLKETSRIVIATELKKRTGKKFVFVKFNPFRVITAFKYINMIFAAMISMSLTYNMYGLLTPIRHVINPRFNLSTPLLGSLFYLAPGMGYMTGAFFGGYYADYMTKKWIDKRNGIRVPEDRLRATVICHGLLQPILGQTVTFTAVNAYCVDCLPHLKGDAIASNYVARYIGGGAISSATCLIQINNIGIGWTSTISAFVLWCGCLGGLLLIVFGAKLRERAVEKFEREKLRKSKDAGSPEK
ncbi:hypothetical protein CANARDRAFT_113371 [[Candida] arabinofermentans NRRL YB-2248]|uniref:Major facilitator superfamily (MFS) profile domain-containing protein n=1 Tax=[Candida] arabinofermentans NRRL YB-2248 TaxID=983967 RepID=A0A1E4T4K0_9ASCO|nr:hypothetical protein CANARDRAFT_113371 [[Candida] arabinofermentans NRRL YB-2248]